MSDYTECPKCGKKSIVQRKNDLYQCLACDFKRDFTPAPKKPKSDNGALWITLITAVIAFFILQYKSTVSDIPALEFQSSPSPTAFQARTENGE
ncbi:MULTISPECIES: hypothetical protein [unclassified Coleofasciculus]|uniref:hypothetical protein n=1 Tax=unclassified Coleofasciculus TaxID=2692782 RepID=UPI00188199E3|nr:MULTISPECIES: hypothetical protein [unclassified Coleofasciculus]MBE9130124.1 hypothetical protein [Coleofasciculus sp. LEGE 07081]MBE9152471.1 hypothetical protein [Coleofasciculus sp. LEGE 07092]